MIPLVSNFQIDIGYTFYEQKSRRRYKPLGGVYISYSNIKSNNLNRFYPWSHVFEFTGYGVL